MQPDMCLEAPESKIQEEILAVSAGMLAAKAVISAEAWNATASSSEG